jgi:hypothetical protein
VKTWGLTCSPCEKYLRGDLKDKVIKVTPGDKDRGIASAMKHVADADPLWSTTPEGIPETPDEQQIHRVRTEQGQRQLETLSAFAALKQANVEIPAQAQWVIDKILDEIAQREIGSMRAIQGSTVCVTGHENASGARFCNTCGVKMNGKTAIEPAEDIYGEPEIPLASLHVATLRKKAREQGLSDKGRKEELISRLAA